jgi:hypothetical protein
MAIKLRKYQCFFHFFVACPVSLCHRSFTARGLAQGPNPRRSEDHLPTDNTHQRTIAMAAMKKKKKMKKAAKK